MSLYNTLFGVNPDSDNLLKVLGTTKSGVPRFRDCYWNGTHIVIHTRTGGGNREFYESEASARESSPDLFGDPETAPKGPWNADLRKLPGYVRDEDDSFDSTYADFFYEPPKEVLEVLQHVVASTPPAERWQALFDALDKQKRKEN